MQEMFRGDGYLGTDLLDHNRLGFAANAGRGTEVREQLREARQFVDVGDLRTARALCAEIVLEYQLELARDRDLLRSAIALLIHARGFQLLTRLLVAVDGRRVRVAMGEPRKGTASPPHLIERYEDHGATSFTVSERLYSDPGRDAMVDRWSEDLAAA